jgi:hypothetical protein
MATEIQYQAFRTEYDEESQRASGLEGRAKLYLTIITAYLGVIGFKIEDLLKFLDKFHVPVALYLAMAVILESFSQQRPTDPDFLDKRLADLAVATNRNSRQNGKVANALQGAGVLIFLAILIQMAVFVVAIKNVGGMHNDQGPTRQQSGQAEGRK